MMQSNPFQKAMNVYQKKKKIKIVELDKYPE